MTVDPVVSLMAWSMETLQGRIWEEIGRDGRTITTQQSTNNTLSKRRGDLPGFGVGREDERPMWGASTRVLQASHRHWEDKIEAHVLA